MNRHFVVSRGSNSESSFGSRPCGRLEVRLRFFHAVAEAEGDGEVKMELRRRRLDGHCQGEHGDGFDCAVLKQPRKAKAAMSTRRAVWSFRDMLGAAVFTAEMFGAGPAVTTVKSGLRCRESVLFCEQPAELIKSARGHAKAGAEASA